MKSQLASALALAASFSSTSALSLHKRQDGAARVLQFDLEKRHLPDPITHDQNRRRKRDGTADMALTNDQTLYFLNATIGTPGQKARLHVDTGSSDLWINSPNSRLCQSRGSPCEEDGTFNPDDSSTFKLVNSDFNISYADGSSSAGDYGTDTVKFQDVTVKNLQFGIGQVSTTPDNILGIGYPSNEVQVVNAGDDPYPNLPAKLKADGTISSNAYSLWLNDLDASRGSLLFGGVDRDRYEGDLVSFPVQKVAGDFYEFFITLTGFDWGSDKLGQDMALAVLLDSGSSLSYLPNDLFDTIFSDVNAQYDQSTGTPYVDCSLADQDFDIKFHFGNDMSIKVPMSELVINASDPEQGQLEFQDGTPACLFGLAPSGGSTNVLGDTFLRSAYVVYDLDNNEISLAQTKFNVKSSDVVEIGRGNDAVPGATEASNPEAAESGLPDQGEPGRAGDGIGGSEPTSIFGGGGEGGILGGGSGGDDDDDAAGILSPPSVRAAMVAAAAIMLNAFRDVAN